MKGSIFIYNFLIHKYPISINLIATTTNYLLNKNQTKPLLFHLGFMLLESINYLGNFEIKGYEKHGAKQSNNKVCSHTFEHVTMTPF